MSTHRELKNAQQALNEAVNHLFRFSATIRDLAVEMGDIIDTPDFQLDPDANAHTIDLCEAALERHLKPVERAHETLLALQMKFDGDRPAVARDTSIAAAKTKPSSAGSLRRRVVEAILARWKLYQAGMTTDQLEVQFKRSHQSVSSAVSDMESKGWIKDSGERRETRSRCKAIVYVPTDLALTWAAEAHLEAN